MGHPAVTRKPVVSNGMACIHAVTTRKQIGKRKAKRRDEMIGMASVLSVSFVRHSVSLFVIVVNEWTRNDTVLYSTVPGTTWSWYRTVRDHQQVESHEISP
jgi:hypothetical protein